MTIPPAFLDEIRARVALSTVVGRRVKLIRAGREQKACCPFHNEKTPSFYVNDDKAFYHCFGCGAHGDVIRFVTEQEGLPFRDAVAQLAAEAGLDMPRETPAARERARAAEGLHDVAAAATDWFERQLHGLAGAEARDYLKERGLSEETIRSFRIGFAPDSRGAVAKALDVPTEKLLAAGLLVQPEDKTREPYDRFRGRVMFPIRDPRGRTVGFGGRVIGDGEPKYLNSPDGPLFDKGRLLYNLDRAAGPARKDARLAVVEGYMDVVALAEAGFAQAVAPMGTALTEDQMKLMWRVVPEPILCFDGDAAGRRAALRAATRALPLLEPGKSLRFAMMPAGTDPDDLVRDRGLDSFTGLLDGAEALIDRLWRAETEGADLSTPERRAAAREALYAHATAIGNVSVQQLYRAEFKSRFDALFTARRSGRTAPAFAGASSRARTMAQRPMEEQWIAAMLVSIMDRPALLDAADEAIAELPIDDPRLARLRAAIFRAVAGDRALDKDTLNTDLAQRGLGTLAEEVRRGNRLDVSFTRPRTPAATAAEDLACVAGHLMALGRIDGELATLRASYEALDEAAFEEQQRLRGERRRVEEELIELSRGRRRDADAHGLAGSTE